MSSKMRGRNDPSSLYKITIETWAIPFPDYCAAVSYDERALKRIIERNDDAFKPFYRTEIIPDSMGRIQPTILMAQEMVDGLTFKLHTSRIKNPQTRADVIEFQKWVMITLGLIRRGQLRPVRWNLGREVPPEYLNISSFPSGKALRRAVITLAERYDVSFCTIYRRLKSIRGGNVETVKGEPKKTRSDKGSYIDSEEFQRVITLYNQNKNLSKKEVACIAGVDYSKVTRWTKTA